MGISGVNGIGGMQDYSIQAPDIADSRRRQ